MGDKGSFVKSLSKDENFVKLSSNENFDYFLLEKVKEEIIKNCSLRDVHYYGISISLEDIRKGLRRESLK